MNQFQLLGSAFAQQSVHSLLDFARVFFSFEKQERAWRNSEPSGHRNDRVETWHLLRALHVSPIIARNIAQFCGPLQAQLGRFPEFSNALRKQGSMFRTLHNQTIAGEPGVLNKRWSVFVRRSKLYGVVLIVGQLLQSCLRTHERFERLY